MTTGDATGFTIWEYSAIVFIVVVVSKLISKTTKTVDVLWLIVFGSILTNLGLLPEHNESLETIGEWGILFIMFALGLEEDLNRFTQGLETFNWCCVLRGTISVYGRLWCGQFCRSRA